MATQNRRTSSALKNRLDTTPQEFDFFQLVRVLEDLTRLDNLAEIGDFTPVASEKIKFRTNPQLCFEPAPVKSLKQTDTAAELLVNFLGLNGASGVLPFHYSELILKQLRLNDASMRDFIDLFNHRSIALFYKAWKKHRPWLKHTSDGATKSKYQKNWHEEILKALAGISTETSASFNNPQGAWINYAGGGARRVSSAATLKNIIQHHFGLKVQIREFRGNWEQLPADVRTRLSDRKSNGTNNVLGMNALLGQQCWNAQNRFEVEIIGIEYDKFMTFAPGSQKLRALYDLIKFKVGTELDFDLSLKIREDRLKAADFTSESRPQLGWNTRLHTKRESNRYIKISVSKYGMQKLSMRSI